MSQFDSFNLNFKIHTTGRSYLYMIVNDVRLGDNPDCIWWQNSRRVTDVRCGRCQPLPGSANAKRHLNAVDCASAQKGRGHSINGGFSRVLSDFVALYGAIFRIAFLERVGRLSIPERFPDRITMTAEDYVACGWLLECWE